MVISTTSSTSSRAGTPLAEGPISDAERKGKHEVELLLNHKLVLCCVTHYLVRLRSLTPADDEWLRL